MPAKMPASSLAITIAGDAPAASSTLAVHCGRHDVRQAMHERRLAAQLGEILRELGMRPASGGRHDGYLAPGRGGCETVQVMTPAGRALPGPHTKKHINRGAFVTAAGRDPSS